MTPTDGKALRGSGALFYLVTDAGDIPVLCATDVVLRWSREVIGATTITSGTAKEKRTRLFEWSVSVTGLTPIENDSSTIGWFYLTQVSGTIQQLKIVYTDDNALQKVVSGNMIIPSGELTSPATDFCNASLEFMGTGVMDISDPESPPSPSGLTELADWWHTVNGNAFIDGASSGQQDGTMYTLQPTDTIVYVGVEGTQFNIVPGTPGNRECQLDLTNHKIIFQNTFDGTQTVQVLFNRP